MGIADAELGSVAVELFDFVLKLCEDFRDAFARRYSSGDNPNCFLLSESLYNLNTDEKVFIRF